MELKPVELEEAEPPELLLIVPYGIETSYRHSGKGAAELLIVPYGIIICP